MTNTFGITPFADPATRTGGSGSAAAPGAKTSTTDSTEGLGNLDTFLKLLVAQLSNQNPLSPTDPQQMVAQLAQFSSVEQQLAMRKDLDAIRDRLAASATGGASATP